LTPPRAWVTIRPLQGSALLAFVALALSSRVAVATPNIAITSQTLNQEFGTATATGSYGHAVPNTGSNLALGDAAGDAAGDNVDRALTMLSVDRP
jgi:hypothetical protein